MIFYFFQNEGNGERLLVLVEGDDLTPNHQTVIVAWDLRDQWSSDAIWTYGTVLLEAPPDISGYRYVLDVV